MVVALTILLTVFVIELVNEANRLGEASLRSSLSRLNILNMLFCFFVFPSIGPGDETCSRGETCSFSSSSNGLCASSLGFSSGAANGLPDSSSSSEGLSKGFGEVTFTSGSKGLPASSSSSEGASNGLEEVTFRSSFGVSSSFRGSSSGLSSFSITSSLGLSSFSVTSSLGSSFFTLFDVILSVLRSMN